ncbi:DUF3040 domain-containing protein [Streptomyces sp. NPDC002073]|uniref:hypothetical protein n=1 Tax=Streptomyces sp. NBC_00239 TaxID=2903640 RepID=UPI002E2DDBAF|nr:hypothetical protein [Streptomyces sp. NBC_00239]
MDGPELSRQERRILHEIEEELRTDRLLDHRLRTLRRGLRPWTDAGEGRAPHGLGLWAAFFGLASTALCARAAATSSPALIWAFAAAWFLTLVCLLLLVIRWCRRAAAAANRRRSDGGGRGPTVA